MNPALWFAPILVCAACADPLTAPALIFPTQTYPSMPNSPEPPPSAPEPTSPAPPALEPTPERPAPPPIVPDRCHSLPASESRFEPLSPMGQEYLWLIAHRGLRADSYAAWIIFRCLRPDVAAAQDADYRANR